MKHNEFTHIPKSTMAFAIDTSTLHIRFKSLKGKAKTVEIIHGDPFMWKSDGDKKTWQGIFNPAQTMIKEASTDIYDYWFASLNVPTKRVKYAFLINGTHLYGSQELVNVEKYPNYKDNLSAFFNFPYLLERDIYSAPHWVRETVWYSIFPDRFHTLENQSKNVLKWESTTEVRNDQFFGGNIKGIIAKLPYLKEMGFTGIYMTPIFQAPSAHKYDTVDYYEIDPQFGSKADFKTLVEEAHKLNIKVMLDAVFNHVSNQHPFFKDALQKGPESKYFDAFYFKEWPIDKASLIKRDAFAPFKAPPYETFAFSPRMPKLNCDNPFMREYLLDVSEYWIREFDIDGWRLDVSNEISHDFWRAFRKRVKNVKEEIFILGENWDQSDPWLMGDQHDAVMNYEFLYAMWAFFGKEEPYPMDARTFANALNDVIFTYPKPVLNNMFNIIDSHDTKRIARVIKEDEALLKLVYTMHYLLPGAPSIYYGGEVGLTGEHDPDNRRCMIWDEQRQSDILKPFIKQLNSLYHKEPSFKLPTLEIVAAKAQGLIVKKGDLIALFNRGETHVTFEGLVATGTYNNLFTGEREVLNKSVTLKPYALFLLKK